MSVAIFDSEGDYGAVTVSGSNLRLSEEDVDQATELFRNGNILVLQNEVLDEANVLAAAAMKKAGSRVLLNAAPARELAAALAGLVDVLLVSAVEAEALAGGPEIETPGQATDAAKILAARFPVAIVTAGGAGVAYAERGGKHGAIPAIQIKLVSTHEAG